MHLQRPKILKLLVAPATFHLAITSFSNRWYALVWSGMAMEYIKNIDNNIYLSSLGIAEIMIKKSLGNLDFDGDILMILNEMTIDILNFDANSALLLDSLPFHHRDPFDRMIISQAITKKYKIISAGRKFKPYNCKLL